MHRRTTNRWSRRAAVRGLSATTLLTSAAACGAADDAGAADELGPGGCRLLPEQTEGPFYFDPELVRADITEGLPGAPLRLRVRVLGANDCAPLPDAVVDVWHTDARGRYSGFSGQGDGGSEDTTDQTFMRGLQITGADGVAEFRTIYPGWYPSRTTHVHIKVHLDDRTLATGQLYFRDEVSAQIYALAPYDARGPKPVSNDGDGIFTTDGGERALVDMLAEGDGWYGTIDVVV
jgi:protocatechuate 3,4-dioxygenase beta subunit